MGDYKSNRLEYLLYFLGIGNYFHSVFLKNYLSDQVELVSRGNNYLTVSGVSMLLGCICLESPNKEVENLMLLKICRLCEVPLQT